MKKNILIATFAAIVMILAPKSSYGTNLEITVKTDYDTETVSVACNTPAPYGQKLSVIVYKLDDAITLNDITNKTDPERCAPLTELSALVRAENIYADKNGNASTKILFGEDDSEGLYIVSVSGGGYLSDISKASAIVYFEKAETIIEETLPRLSSAGKDELEALFDEKQLMLGIETGDGTDYADNKELINSLFVSSRSKDFNNRFRNMGEVSKCFKIVEMLRNIYSCENEAQYQSVIENNAALINIDTGSAEYAGREQKIYSLFKTDISQNKPTSLLEVRNAVTRSIALNMINNSNAKSITAYIEKYINYLDLSEEAYKTACKKFGAVEINKAFVEKDFTYYTQIKDAFDARLKALSKKESPSEISGGGGRSSVSIDKNITTEKKETLPEVFENPFTDVGEEHWAIKAIEALTEMNVINGFPDGSFRPEEQVTREQFVKMIAVAFNWKLNSDNEAAYGDLTAGHWSNTYITAAKNKKVISGVGENIFGLGRSITRQDAAVIIYNSAKAQSLPIKEDTFDYDDSGLISEYAKNAVGALSAANIINGTGNNRFEPTATLTRAQASKMIYEILRF